MSALPPRAAAILAEIVARRRFSELDARSRALALLDAGATELCGPFAGLESPWLEPQGLVPESDDGVVVARGSLGGAPILVVAIEGGFLGGAIGEVGGAKLTVALELAARDSMPAALVLETGGVRLQEANLGLGAIAEIEDAVLALREVAPVVGIVAGPLGCFGGMGIVAGLTSALILTRGGRLGLNGPEVIESEAGRDELDSTDRALVWSLDGGEARVAIGQADALVDDEVDAVRAALSAALHADTSVPRSRDLTSLAAALERSRPATPAAAAALVEGRGQRWTEALITSRHPSIPSLMWGEAELGGEQSSVLTVVPDPTSPFHRARNGEVGLAEALALAEAIEAILQADAARAPAEKRPILAVVDVPSQAYGRLEEQAGLHQFLAAATDAYARARRRGHPVVALVVGSAISGGFLAHGLQANQVLALDDTGVEIHAMHKPAAARITRRTLAELDELASRLAPLSYDVRRWAELGRCDGLITVGDADRPSPADLAAVRDAVTAAIARGRNLPTGLFARVTAPTSPPAREASRAVAAALAAAW